MKLNLLPKFFILEISTSYFKINFAFMIETSFYINSTNANSL